MGKLKLYLFTAVSLSVTAVSIGWLFLFIHYQTPGDGGVAGTAFNALLLLLWGLFHSLLARDQVKRRIADLVGINYVRMAYNTVSGITLMGVLYFWQDLPGTIWRIDGAWYWVLTSLYLVFIAGMAYSLITVGLVETAGLSPFMKQGEIPSGKINAPSTSGPYAYCRHPFYLFYILALMTGPVMTTGRLEFALLNVLYCFIGTNFEERSLRKEFGVSYDLYGLNVPMWIPRLTPWRPQQ